MLNDAGFHTNLDAEPQRNIAITAKLTAPTSRVKSNTLLVGLFAQGRGLLAGGDVLVAGWDPLTDSGWYLAQNNAGWQFYARSYPGETALNMSFAGDASTEHCIVLAVDLGADTVQLWVDGVSLTLAAAHENGDFDIAIIPHTWTVTTLGSLQVGSKVNLEVDMLARYGARMIGADAPRPEGTS